MDKQKKKKVAIGVSAFLIVFLICFGVFIKLRITKTSNEVDRLDKQISQQHRDLRLEISKGYCKELCSLYIDYGFDDRDAIEYCRAYVRINMNDDSDSYDYFEYGSFDVCEDRIYCFHLYDCRLNNITLDFNKCVEIMCKIYTETKGSRTEAEEYMRGNVLVASEKTWLTFPYHTCVEGLDYESVYEKEYFNSSANYVGKKINSWYNKLVQDDFCVQYTNSG